MEGTFIELIRTYGYIILFVWCVLEGETALVIAGVFSHTGDMNLPIALAIGTLGGMAGDLLYFHIGRYNKNYIYKKLNTQRRKFAIAHILLKKYGRTIIFFQRFMYGLRIVVPMSVGLTRYSRAKFILINGISSFTWACLFCLPAWYMGDTILGLLAYGQEHWYFALPMVVLFVGSIFYFFHRVENTILKLRSER